MVKKKLFLLSIFSGFLLSLPWIVPSLGFLLLFAFVPLLVAEEVTVKQKGALNGVNISFALVAFLLWNVLSTWWVAHVSFAGMLIIVFLNSVIMASVWWLSRQVRCQFGDVPGYFSLIVFWMAFEFFHHNWVIQWPWLTLGNGLANSVKMIQWYEFTGALGGSLWILIANIASFLFVKNLYQSGVWKSMKFGIISLLIIFLPVCWSVFRYGSYEENGATLEVVILQPNIDPYTEKFSGMTTEEQVQKLVLLAESAVSESTDLVLAPETALPVMWEDSLNNGNGGFSEFGGLFRMNPDLKIIAGALTQRKIAEGEPVSETARWSEEHGFYYDVFNSAMIFDRISSVQISHKSILVSGVERMPFQDYFSFLGKYSFQIGGIGGSLGSSGGPVLFEGRDAAKIGPVICFESAFGEYVGNMARNGASILTVLTNDGWWKRSPGSWQHFGYSRMRAIETRRSIARCANTGISGFISQRGEVLTETELGVTDVIGMPVRLNETVTFYARYGDYLGKFCVLLSVLIMGRFWLVRWRS